MTRAAPLLLATALVLLLVALIGMDHAHARLCPEVWHTETCEHAGRAAR